MVRKVKLSGKAYALSSQYLFRLDTGVPNGFRILKLSDFAGASKKLATRGTFEWKVKKWLIDIEDSCHSTHFNFTFNKNLKRTC